MNVNTNINGITARPRSCSSKARYGSKSKMSLQDDTTPHYLIDRYLQQRYGIHRQDESFDRRDDLVNSKQIYEMLEANKENNHFTFKKVVAGRELGCGGETVPMMRVAGGNGENVRDRELVRRLERAEREIETQKQRVRELERNLSDKPSKTQVISLGNQKKSEKSSSIHKRFSQRVQQMMQSVEGSSSHNLQQVWRWLKNKMEHYQKLKIEIKKIQQLVEDKELIRADEISKVLQEH